MLHQLSPAPPPLFSLLLLPYFPFTSCTNNPLSLLQSSVFLGSKCREQFATVWCPMIWLFQKNSVNIELDKNQHYPLLGKYDWWGKRSLNFK